MSKDTDLKKKISAMTTEDLIKTRVTISLIQNIAGFLGVSGMLFLLFFPTVTAIICLGIIIFLLADYSAVLGQVLNDITEAIDARQINS